MSYKIKKNKIIAIDGPAGAGKSTAAKIIAKKLKIFYVDSGAMYRAVTYYLLKNNLLLANEKTIKSSAKKLKITFKVRNKKQYTFLNNRDVTKEIRSQEVNKNVSQVASMKCIRELLVKMQKNLGRDQSIVMDGRDIGTNVFPDATLKIYLTASNIKRAERRKKELDKTGERVSLTEQIKDIDKRDNIDSSRRISPLSKANNAILLDCTNMKINEVVENILYFVKI